MTVERRRLYRVPMARPTCGSEERNAMKRILVSGRYTMGRETARFEHEWARRCGVPYAVMTNSGSSANLLAVSVLRSPLAPRRWRLRSGDRVVVPALCWSTTVWPLLQLGLRPVFVDVDPRSLCLDPACLETGPARRARAVIVVHLLGNCCDMDRLVSICRRRRQVLVEDACEAVGSTWRNRWLGTYGQMGTFSFFYSHQISTMEGGMVVTRDPRLAELLRIQRAHGWVRDLPPSRQKAWAPKVPAWERAFMFFDTGYNLRPIEISAALGRVQLRRLNQIRRARMRAYRRLHRRLLRWSSFLVFLQVLPPARPCWFAMPIIFRPSCQRWRDPLIRHLEARGIETRPLIAGNLVRHPALRHQNHEVAHPLTESDSLSKRSLLLPIHSAPDEETLVHLERSLDSFFRFLPLP